MPAVSQSQRALFAIALHHPEKLHSENRGLAQLPQRTLHDFAATPSKGLPQRRKNYGEEGMPPVVGSPEHGASGHDTYRAQSGGSVLVDKPGHEWHKLSHGVVEETGDVPSKYLEDGGNWIGDVTSKPGFKKGALTAEAHAAGMSPMSFARKHYHDPGKVGARSRFAVNAQR